MLKTGIATKESYPPILAWILAQRVFLSPNLLIQDLDYSCRSAALRDRNGHVFIAFAVNCTDPRQIKEHHGSQQDYDDPMMIRRVFSLLLKIFDI